MPISDKTNRSLVDFYDTSDANAYDDYGDDFEADSDKGSFIADGRDNKSKEKKELKYFDREGTSNTENSVLFNKRKGKSFGPVVGGYRDNSRSAYSDSLTPRQKASGRGGEKTRHLAGSKMKKGVLHSSPKQRSDGVVVRRVLSANRNKVNALQNLILELQSENEQLRLENRDLKRSSRIQEKVIKKYDNEEAEIPLLIQKHNSEVRVLREKLKKQREGLERSRDDMHRKDLEIQKLRDKVRKYEDLVRDKQLDEREKLQQKLSRLENDMSEKELKISELERVIKLSERARARETKEKNDKYRKAVEELRKLENDQRDLAYRFKEKEKELEVQNIYSQRIALKKRMPKPESKQGSYSANGFNSSRLSKPSSPLVMDVRETPRIRTIDRIDTMVEDKEAKDTESLEASQVETMVSALKKKEEELEKILGEERKRRQLEEDQRKLKEMEEKIRRKEEEIFKAEREREEKRREEEQIKEEAEKIKVKLDAERELTERKFLETVGREKEMNLQAIKRLELEAANEAEQAAANNDEVKKKAFHTFQAGLNEDAELLAHNRVKTKDWNKDKPHEDPLKPLLKAKAKPIFLESSRKDEEHIKHQPLDFRLTDSNKIGSKGHNVKRSGVNSVASSHPDASRGENRSKPKGDDGLLFGEYNPTVNSAGRKRTSRFNGQEDKDSFLFFDTKSKNQSREPDSSQNSASNTAGDVFLTSRHRTKSPLDEDKKPQSRGKADQAASANVFGVYQPTFGKHIVDNKTDPSSPEDDLFSDDRPKYGRRGKGQKPAPDKGLFETGLDNTRAGVANLFSGVEKKADNVGTSAVKAVTSFADDDIEEMVLI